MTVAARRPAWLWPVLFWIVVLTLAVVIGRYAQPAFLGTAPGARPVARLPPPPSDLPTWLFQLGVGSVVWYAAMFSLPFLLLAARRLDPDRLGRARTIVLVVSATALLITATSALDYVWTYGQATTRPALGAWVPMSLRQHVLPWLALIGGVAAIEARRRTIRTIVERERLRAEVAEQRLIALAGQLRPHFLFNALQAVSTLIHRDPNAADEMLTRLSDLLRDVLRHRDSSFVRLEEEVRYARTWLDIAKVRFADRLTFEIDVPAELNDVTVPLFILQPLVENALAHGIGGTMTGGRVVIRARRSGGRLVLEVIDDGAGLRPASQRREGIGLANTRERLQASFGADQRLTIEPAATRGTIARVELPARETSRHRATA